MCHSFYVCQPLILWCYIIFCDSVTVEVFFRSIWLVSMLWFWLSAKLKLLTGYMYCLEEFAFALRLLWKRKFIIYSATTSGPVTLHVLSSHNMSAESIRDVLRSDLWAACSSLVCFTENDHCSCLVNRHALFLHSYKLSCCFCALLLLSLHKVIWDARFITCQYRAESSLLSP